MSGAGGQRRIGVVIACAALALSASPALAKKKGKKKPTFGPVVTVSVTGNVASTAGSESTATAPCPLGTKAVGGGFSVTPPTMTDAMLVDRSMRGPGESWTVRGNRLAGSGAATALAYCRATKKTILDVPASASVAPAGGAMGVATATCPGGSRLIGGGFESTKGPGNTAVTGPQTSLSQSPGSWTLISVNNTSAAQTVTAHAYCVAGIPAPVLLNTTTPGTVPNYASATATTSACPAPAKKKGKAKSAKKKRKKKPVRKRLSGGGFASVNGATAAPVPFFHQSQLSSGWHVAATNVGTAGSMPVTSQAICF
jgi:hypothetical protein